MNKQIMPPDVVVRRLPLYARTLAYLQAEGVTSVSSQELGSRINVTAAQIRKDLSYFGQLGKQGIGYNVDELLEQNTSRLRACSQAGRTILPYARKPRHSKV